VVGRPNVGKSTLVNRLTGRRDAIVEERPGVTRDRTSHAAEWRGERYAIIDTGGWTPGWAPDRDAIDIAVAAQAEIATEQADLVMFIVDVTVGVTEEDAAVAGWLRTGGVPVLLVANKADNAGNPAQTRADLADLYRLGLGDPVPVSALHGRGSGDLLDEVVDRLRASGATDQPVEVVPEIPSVALIGRQNVGKSSLFNRLVGSDRVVVDDRPGTTRDAVDSLVGFPDGRTYRFVDTAGLRRKKSKSDATEYYSTVRTVQALDAASLALLVVDAGEPIGEQEQKLARQILDSGRAVAIVLNKWDLVDEDRRERIDKERDRLLRFIDYAPLVRTSATSGRGIIKLPDQMDAALGQWSRRIPTATLNDWLAEAVTAQAPPMRSGRAVRLRYITQVASGPPTFRVFSTAELEPGYLRYLERRLREEFGFVGTPLDIGVRVRAGWNERDGAGGGSGGKTAKKSRQRARRRT
jgi:GTP-binding protein